MREVARKTERWLLTIIFIEDGSRVGESNRREAVFSEKDKLRELK